MKVYYNRTNGEQGTYEQTETTSNEKRQDAEEIQS